MAGRVDFRNSPPGASSAGFFISAHGFGWWAFKSTDPSVAARVDRRVMELSQTDLRGWPASSRRTGHLGIKAGAHRARR